MAFGVGVADGVTVFLKHHPVDPAHGFNHLTGLFIFLGLFYFNIVRVADIRQRRRDHDKRRLMELCLRRIKFFLARCRHFFGL